MRESEVVAAIVAGDPAGLAEAYNRYSASLYTYCRTMLREPADAADAVQDTFVIAASKLSGLRDPGRLRSWLYAVARNECHRRLRSSGEQAPLEEAPDVPDETADVSAGAERAELRGLVRVAMTGLGPAERDVLELHLRQGLASDEVASVLGISRNHAHALLSRARSQLETALGVLVVARAGRRGCPALGTLLNDWDGRLTVLLRNRVNRHIERCPVCSERRRREMVPAMFLGAVPIAGLPLASAALALVHRGQVLRAAAGRTMYTFGHHGFPRPLDPPRAQMWRQWPVHAGAAAVTAAALTFAVTMVATPPHHAARPAGGRTAGTVPFSSATATRGADAAARPSAAVGASHPSASATDAQPTASPPAPSATGTTAPATGTLNVSPTTIDVVPPAAGSITLTASGGPVNWAVREPPGLPRKVVVSPMSGALIAGATTTVSVTANGPGQMHVHLVFSPGGTTVTVVVG